MGTVALGSAARAAGADGADSEEPEYAVGLLRADCLGRPCGPFRILDLEGAAVTDGTDIAALRVQLGERAIVGFSWTEDARTWSLEGSRLHARVRDRDGRLEMMAGWLGHRVDVSVGAAERERLAGGGWVGRAALGYRTSSRLRLGLDLERDLDDRAPAALAPRPRTAVRASARWQPSPRLELEGGVGWARLLDGLDERSERWSLDGTLHWQAPRLLVRVESRYEDTRSRFRRRDVTAGIGIDLRVAPHLLVSGAVREGVELGVAERARSWQAGLTLHGRGYRFPRGGRTGAAVERLAELAWAAGYGLTRVYDVEGLRGLRERMRLTDDPALRAAADAVYRAQVRDRRVPSVQLRWESARREDVALRVRTGQAVVSVPWRPAWPWVAGEQRTEWLRLELAYTEARFAGDTLELGRRIALEADLNRELLLRVAWERRIRSPLELALGREPVGGLLASLRYAYGR